MGEAARKKEGRVLRVSKLVEEHLNSLRLPKEGFDSCLRRQFGLPARNGHEQPLKEYFIIDTPDTLIIKRTLAEAKGEAILLAVKRGEKLSHKQKKDPITKVKETP